MLLAVRDHSTGCIPDRVDLPVTNLEIPGSAVTLPMRIDRVVRLRLTGCHTPIFRLGFNTPIRRRKPKHANRND
jgi:hypothetical protein